MEAPQVSDLLIYVTPEGRLTVDFLKVLQILIAMANDHEARITALEP